MITHRYNAPMEFANTVVVVTGASSGIGHATAVACAARGGAVLATGRDAAALDAVVAQIEAAGGRAEACAVDLTSDEGPRAVVAAAVAAYGGIDVLVNAAGIIATGAVDQTSDELWDRVMALNVRAPFRLIREAAPHLRERRGAIVNVSSVNGLRAFAGLAAYNVSKAAIDHLTRCAALDFAADGVRVNGVNPGMTITNLHKRGGMSDEQYAAFVERARTTHPLGRPGQAEEIAELILFLASGRSGWVTGETIAIDGGRHLTCNR